MVRRAARLAAHMAWGRASPEGSCRPRPVSRKPFRPIVCSHSAVSRVFLVVVLLLAPLAEGAGRYVTDRVATPVKWMAWGPAAIQRAQKEQRPIFLSIGFAASWESERMHREAFLVPANVHAINTWFVPVLLDRIEYPEVAAVYDGLLRSMTGTGGLPANLVLTPTLEPFGAAGAVDDETLGRMLVRNANRWQDERVAVLAEGRANVQKALASRGAFPPEEPTTATLEAVVDAIANTYDATNGGFGPAPRTIRPTTLSFLLRYAARTKNDQIRELVIDTLKKVSAAPIRDQLGGGFHRATRDAAWQEPFYEKMLVDQALVGDVLVDAWKLSRDGDLLHAARTTYDYVLRDLHARREILDASQDAHSIIPLGRPVFANGGFYVWQAAEVLHLLGDEQGKKVLKVYEIGDERPTLPSLKEARFLPETYTTLAQPLARLLDVRQKRPAPFRERGTAAGNGLMIASLARAARELEEPRYAEAAALAANAVVARLWTPATTTLVRTADRTAALNEDYAFMVSGLLELYETTYDIRWLELAIAMQKKQDATFWNAAIGRYDVGRSVPASLGPLFVESDTDAPSSNAISARNLQRLAALTGNAAWAARPATIFQSFGGYLQNRGAELPSLADAIERSYLLPSVVVVIGEPRATKTHELLAQWRSSGEPLRAHVLLPWKGTARDRVVRSMPWAATLERDAENPIAYLCTSGRCTRQGGLVESSPVVEPEHGKP